jgi:SAM-dependent methyltransferase
MPLDNHAQDWNDLAKEDALWAIHTAPDRRFGKWDADAFFATGEEDVAEFIASVERLERPAQRKAALDFGCGVGRLTRALGKHFESVVGVDISTVMIDKAKEFNVAHPQCSFIVNTEDHLGVFEDQSFDFIGTKWVLHHLPERSLAENYIREFIRILRPGGLLIFQMRVNLSLKTRLQLGRRLYGVLRSVGVSEHFLYNRLRLNPMRMISIPEKDTVALIAASGAKLLDVEHYWPRSGAGAVYYVTK